MHAVYSPKLVIARSFSTSLAFQRGLVLGAYESPDGVEYTELSPVGQKLDDKLGGKLREALNGLPAGIGRLGSVVTVTNVSPEFFQIAVAGLGFKAVDFNEIENVNIRTAAGLGARALQKIGVQDIAVEGFNDPLAAAEGATLGVWYNTDKEIETKVSLYEGGDLEDWERGVIIADSQNLVRCLCEKPAKYLNPRILANRAQDLLCPYGVSVQARDTLWMKTHNLNDLRLLSDNKMEPPMALELNYENDSIPSTKAYVLIGQGTSFESCSGLYSDKIHIDIAPSAIILGVFKALAAMRLRINMRAFIPLYKNTLVGWFMEEIGGSVTINETELRTEDIPYISQLMILSEALIYVTKVYKPKSVITLGTGHNDDKFVDQITYNRFRLKCDRRNKHKDHIDVHKSNDINYLNNKLYKGSHARKLIQKMCLINTNRSTGVPETSHIK